MRLLSLVLLCAVLATHGYGQAQLVKEPTFASPNAASLGKYGDIPVSYHTGVPEISIPIYTVQEGSLNLSISLSYHSSGIRVDEVASFVGLGWSLNGGNGMITRTVHGGPDEGGVSGSAPLGNSPYTGWGWYKDGGIQPQVVACGSTPLSINSPSGVTAWTGGCASLCYEASRGYVDSEPDLYTFNFAGYSGKFFFDASRKVHMIPESDVYIEPINTPSYFYAWKVIAPDGTKYFFGGTAKEISYSDPAELNSKKQVSSSTTWYMYRMESANGEDWIDFEYADDTYSFGNRLGHSVTFREFDASPVGGAGTKPAGEILGGAPLSAPLYLATTVVDGKRLTKITTGSGQVIVDFTPSTSAREDLTHGSKSGGTLFYDVTAANTTSKSLQFIQITTPTMCKKFELSYDYFPSATCTGCTGIGGASTTYDQKRLRLNWVQESDCATSLKPRYEFFYDTQPLPRRYSLARDMWGYYNGSESNTGLLESFTNPVAGITVTYTTSNSRSVNEAKAQAGILTKIKYPTSGTTEFSFESHKVTDSSPKLGGLRIKTITNKNDFGNTTKKNVKYLQGTLYMDPANFKNHYPNNNDIFSGAYLGGFDFGIAHASDPLPALWSSQGYHIGYTSVRVEEPGNGFTLYTYLNTNPSAVNSSEYPFKPSVAAVGTSELVQETNHLEGNTNDNVFISKTYSYKQPTSSSQVVNARRVETVNCINCTGSATEYGLHTDYSITTYRFNTISTSVTKDGVTTLTENTYGNTHNAPKSIQFTDSKGLTRRTEYIYPDDAGSGAPTSMYVKSPTVDPNFKNLLTTPIEEKTLVNGVLKARSVRQYTQNGTKLFLTSVKNYPTGTTEFTEDQYKYDANGNLSGIVKSTGVYRFFQWAYQNKYPIAVADFPANYAAGSLDIFHTSFEEETTNFILDPKVGRKSWKSTSAYSKALTGLDPGQYVLSYYSKSGSVWTLQSSVVTVPASGAYTISIAANSQVDELRFYPKGALMQTYTYDPGLGITSSSNANHVASYYIYDSLGRLKMVKNDSGEIVKLDAYNYKIK